MEKVWVRSVKYANKLLREFSAHIFLFSDQRIISNGILERMLASLQCNDFRLSYTYI